MKFILRLRWSRFQHSIYVLGVIFFLIGIGACHSTRQLSGLSFKDYSVTKKAGVDSSYVRMIAPYSDSLGKSMNEVLCNNERELIKDMPNSDLGNFLADAYLWAARKKLDAEVDMAFMNHGGVRVNRIGAGPVTRTHIYEVMPFDNQLVIVEVPGSVLREFVDRLAAEGGGGGVAGITYRIGDKKAVDVRVGRHPLNDSTIYRMANSDYVVDGGGGFKGFQQLPQRRDGYLMRDAIMEYCMMHQQSGKGVGVEMEKRIVQ